MKANPTPSPESPLRLQPAILQLERAIGDLLDSHWDEVLRRRAHEVAEAVTAGCKEWRLHEMSGVAQAIMSLLALKLEDVISIQDALREKLFELLAMLKDMAAALAA
jgi:hypothetical protein